MDKWFNVNKVIQVWSGHSDGHQKMGKLFPPAAIRAIDEYKGSVQFEEYMLDADGRSDLVERGTSYPQWWARLDDLSLEPFTGEEPGPVGPDEPAPSPEPSPVGEPSDEEVGRVVKYLLSLL